MYYQVNYRAPPSMKGGSMMRYIGPPVTRNSFSTIFVLQQGTDFQHPSMINLITKIGIIDLWTTKNGVTFCSPWRQNTTEINICIKLKYLRPLIQHLSIIITIDPQGCCEIGRQGVVSYQSSSSRVRRPPNIKVKNITAWWARRLECVSAGIIA